MSDVNRKLIDWFPKIDYSKCTGCKECFKFCKHKVFGWNKEKKQPIVANPYECVIGCMTCSTSVCKQGAISHPSLKDLKKMTDKAKKGCCSSGEGTCCGSN